MINRIKVGIFFFHLILMFTACSTTHGSSILRSMDIGEIQNYLNQAHPDDPKVTVLKKRIVELKNKQWKEGAARARPMAARPICDAQSAGWQVNPKEFERLLREDKEHHKEKTVKVLNEMFSNDKGSHNAVLMIKNQSQCNTILHIVEGDEEYDLAVPLQGENFIILEKGKYTISASICGAKYEKIKNLDHSMYITLK
ncbi:hypothetical protein KB553_09845 [Chryseobacterium rhizoplanae]|uniref:DUF6759 domain-containing protein n=1 Tax=Chryseobacterium rhizoplanae TaxID=1609531 RepID=UPI001CE24C33|nr:DUF6759 domain-containing protein [Chryseobacterium rhizoplanae]UCA61806.1 hypothetical protein KB553_09845 [Chryseobacterium rhizoplanae]